MSDASSAGSHRLTSGQDVLRRVDVPVVPGAAGRARPLPGAQAQLREQVPARRAGLARRVPPADHDQFPAVPLALVLKLAAELAPAAVADGAGQMPVADHAGDVEVLDHDHVRRADQTGAGAVQEVPPGIADLAVGTGHLRRGLGPVSRPLPAAGQAPLVPGQVAGLARQVPRVGDLLPVRRHAPRSTPTACPVGPAVQGAGVDGEGHIPAAARLPGHDHHRGVQRGHVDVRPGPGEPQRGCCLGQPQLAAAHREGAAGVVRGLPAAAGFEPRAAGASGEERGECLVLVAECLLQRHRGDLVQEGQVRVLLHDGQRGVGLGIGGALAFGLPAGVPGSQGPVPHHTDAAEGAVQHLLLLFAGICPAPVSRPHPYSIEQTVVRGREARRARCLLVLLPRFAGHRIPPWP